jgi:four helix bundle protein
MQEITSSKISSFTDLIAWQQAHQLVIAIYQITKALPAEEKYALGDQLRRAVISISSNIAEGFSRQSPKEKIQFYYTAKGSLTEIQNQLLVCRDVNYIGRPKFKELAEQSVHVSKLIVGLIKSLKTK